jgi:hypothetical protein
VREARGINYHMTVLGVEFHGIRLGHKERKRLECGYHRKNKTSTTWRVRQRMTMISKIEIHLSSTFVREKREESVGLTHI